MRKSTLGIKNSSAGSSSSQEATSRPTTIDFAKLGDLSMDPIPQSESSISLGDLFGNLFGNLNQNSSFEQSNPITEEE